MQKYKFYIQEVEWKADSNSYVALSGASPTDIEDKFKGLKYSKCEGLEDVGEANLYTEEYADSDRLRVYIPSDLTHKATEIKLTLFFVGDERRNAYNAFNDWIMGKTLAYWDTARNKKLIFFVKNPVKPSNDKFKGSTPYIEVTYTLSNVYGKAESLIK